MNSKKLLTTCKLVTKTHLKQLFIRGCKETNQIYCVKRKLYVTPTMMAQRSITSFFKVTPQKAKDCTVKDESKEGTEEIVKSKVNGKVSLNTKEAEKKPSKRSRLDSSGSEAELSKSKTPSEKKKKLKRQQIESSGSESESNKSDNQQSPEHGKCIVKEELVNSPIKTSPEKEASIKVEKSTTPKTYDSPKSKKRKAKSLTVVKKMASPTKDSPEKTPSPKNVKQEVVSNGDVDNLEKNKENEKNVKNLDEQKDKAGEKVLDSEYNPAKAKYHPVQDACWSKGQPVPYLALARTLEAIEGTSARLRMIDILANYFRSVVALTPEDLLPSVYLCLNQLAPAYESLELGIAETYLLKAVGQCTGMSVSQARAAAARAGDLGAAAAAARATQRTMFASPPLRAAGVLHALRDIAAMTGHASVNKKISKIQSLFVACRQCEAKFLIRSLEGKLRIGLAEQSVLQALAVAVSLTPPGGTVLDASKGVAPDVFKKVVEENALVIKTTYCECPDYGRVVPALLHGVPELPARCRLAVGTPLKPMLAHPTRGVAEVFNRFEGCEFTCEWKYDGERAQIHVPCVRGQGEGQGEGSAPDYERAAIFSRNQENNTTKYPDVLRRLPLLLKESVTSCVLDCEVVAYDTVNNQILPFQVLSTRKRKGAVESELKVQVCVFVFDVLLLNGTALVRDPLRARRSMLREHFRETDGAWQFARWRDCDSAEQVQQFLEEAVSGGCEGLMVKTLEGDAAKYDIARRSRNWLKLKKDYLEGCGDSVDVVVMGAYRGRGRRSGAWGGFLAAARDPGTDSFQALCRLGTGFTDRDLADLAAQLEPHRLDHPPSYYSYDPSHTPDVWFAPACVWEIRCADLSLSPVHRAACGLIEPGRGVSLRFPRFIRVREDKSPEQATSAQQVADMYLAQDQLKNLAPRQDLHGDDFY